MQSCNVLGRFAIILWQIWKFSVSSSPLPDPWLATLSPLTAMPSKCPLTPPPQKKNPCKSAAKSGKSTTKNCVFTSKTANPHCTTTKVLTQTHLEDTQCVDFRSQCKAYFEIFWAQFYTNSWHFRVFVAGQVHLSCTSVLECSVTFNDLYDIH